MIDRTSELPREVHLAVDEVHVWIVSLDETPIPQVQLEGVLSSAETDRACRFRFPRDRRRFAAGRGLLRVLLSSYVGASPAELQFPTSYHGKPSLARPCCPEDLQFNVSHSDSWMMIGVTHGRSLGVDVESVRPLSDCDQIAERFFSATEVAALRSLPAKLRTRAFFTCWTRKEAYIKAVGGGLSIPLDRFDVSLAPGEPAALLTVDGSSETAAQWTLWGLTPAQGAIAAVATQSRDVALVSWRWEASSQDES
jgi:4'-phosphopantetheinyl transferase